MKKLSALIPIIIVLVAIGAGLFFLSRQENEAKDDGKIRVAASTMVVADIARNIAGENIEVVQIMPNGANPHSFEPSVEDKRKVVDVDVMFVIGAGYDKWAENLAEPGTKIATLDQGIELLSNGRDPHYWLAVSNARIMSETIRDELIALDPANEVTYETNYEKYTNHLTNLKTEITELLTGLESRKIITYHEAFTYFASDFDLEIVATIEPNTGQEPGPEYLAQVGNIIKQHDIKVLFKEPQMNDAIITGLAKDYDLEVATLDAEGGVEGVGSYEELIRYNAQTINQVLGDD